MLSTTSSRLPNYYCHTIIAHAHTCRKHVKVHTQKALVSTKSVKPASWWSPLLTGKRLSCCYQARRESRLSSWVCSWSMALAGVGQHFSRNLDQYTIMCVFGSVVGCVVLPLMAHVRITCYREYTGLSRNKLEKVSWRRYPLRWLSSCVGNACGMMCCFAPWHMCYHLVGKQATVPFWEACMCCFLSQFLYLASYELISPVD